MKRNIDAAEGRVSLARALSKFGVCSRTQALQIVAEKRVTVNGHLIVSPAYRVDMMADRIAVDSTVVRQEKKFIYLLLHKPTDYITTRIDERGRKTVYELLTKYQTFIFPVGRLDKDTSGALLMTNDSQLAEKITNPNSNVPKTYLVTAEGTIDEFDLQALRAGVVIDRDYRTKPALVTDVSRERGMTACSLTITEGKNRQVRKMFKAIGHPIRMLHRQSVGPVNLGTLPSGKTRLLDEAEIDELRKSVVHAGD